MSLKMKLTSSLLAMVLMFVVMLTGILAASQQTITMQGSVNFEIADKSLYVQDVRMQESSEASSTIYSLKDQGRFMPGYINEQINMNLGTFTNTYGSFALYFDIINTSTYEYTTLPLTTQTEVDVTLAIQDTSGGVLSTIPTGTVSPEEITSSTSATAVLVLKITSSKGIKVDLSSIIITLEKVLQYQRVDEDGTPNPEGDYILFGYYPQTIKASNVTIDTSTTDNRGYYQGSDGEYYAAVSANPSSDATFSDGTTITEGTTYYFKVEPLKWRILTEDYNGQGNALVVSDKIINAMAYREDYTSSYATDKLGEIIYDRTAKPGKGVNSLYQVYANNYKHSEVREWLIGEFYNNAFTTDEQLIIQLTTVDNSLASTNNNGGQYVCEDTEDYVFLLSLYDAVSSDYADKVSKAVTTSDYSRANYAYTATSGTYQGTGDAWLRSPHSNVAFAYRIGSGNERGRYIDSGDFGVVPALQIQL